MKTMHRDNDTQISKSTPKALPAPGRGRDIEANFVELTKLDPKEFAAISTAMRQDILTRARQHALYTGGPGSRESAVRISAMKKSSAEFSQSDFIGAEVVAFDRKIFQTTMLASDKDREAMKSLFYATQTRHHSDKKELENSIYSKGYDLQEVVSLKNEAWFDDESYTKKTLSNNFDVPSKAALFAEVTNGNRHPSATAALRYHGGLGAREGARMSEGHMIIVTPRKNNVSKEQYDQAIQEGDKAALKKMGITAVASTDIRNAAKDLKDPNPERFPAKYQYPDGSVR
jgi:hypothetical protein